MRVRSKHIKGMSETKKIPKGNSEVIRKENTKDKLCPYTKLKDLIPYQFIQSLPQGCYLSLPSKGGILL